MQQQQHSSQPDRQRCLALREPARHPVVVLQPSTPRYAGTLQQNMTTQQ
jgi:hypothetical protein